MAKVDREWTDVAGQRWGSIDGQYQALVPTYRRILWKLAGHDWWTGGHVMPDRNKPPLSKGEWAAVVVFCVFMVWAFIATGGRS